MDGRFFRLPSLIRSLRMSFGLSVEGRADDNSIEGESSRVGQVMADRYSKLVTLMIITILSMVPLFTIYEVDYTSQVTSFPRTPPCYAAVHAFRVPNLNLFARDWGVCVSLPGPRRVSACHGNTSGHP